MLWILLELLVADSLRSETGLSASLVAKHSSDSHSQVERLLQILPAFAGELTPLVAGCDQTKSREILNEVNEVCAVADPQATRESVFRRGAVALKVGKCLAR